MFTIRHVTPWADNLYQGDQVTHANEGAMASSNLGALEIRSGDTFIAGLWDGMAYVMNDKGSTVARYDLPPDPRVATTAGVLGETANAIF